MAKSGKSAAAAPVAKKSQPTNFVSNVKPMSAAEIRRLDRAEGAAQSFKRAPNKPGGGGPPNPPGGGGKRSRR